MANEFILLTPEVLEQSGVAISPNSSATAAGMPWSNLLNEFPFEKVRTASMTGVKLIGDLGVAREIREVLLPYANARAETDWRIRLADTEGGLDSAAGDDDSGDIDFWPAGVPSTFASDWPLGTFGFWRANSVRTRRWFQIEIDDPTLPAGYFEGGGLLLGKGFQPTRTWIYGGDEPTELEPTTRSRSMSGYAYPLTRGRPTSARYLFKGMPFAEYRELRRIFRLRGSSRHVATIVDPTNTANLPENVIHGLLTGLDHFSRPRYVNGGWEYSVEITIESMGGNLG